MIVQTPGSAAAARQTGQRNHLSNYLKPDAEYNSYLSICTVRKGRENKYFLNKTSKDLENRMCCILMKGFRFYLYMCVYANVYMQEPEEDIWSVVLSFSPIFL